MLTRVTIGRCREPPSVAHGLATTIGCELMARSHRIASGAGVNICRVDDKRGKRSREWRKKLTLGQ